LTEDGSLPAMIAQEFPITEEAFYTAFILDMFWDTGEYTSTP